MPTVSKRCEVCDRVPASDEEWDTIPEEKGDQLCWGGYQCYTRPVDWRARALAAEALLAKENIDA